LRIGVNLQRAPRRGGGQWHADDDGSTVRLDIAEKLVVLALALRQLRRQLARACNGKVDSVAIKVIAIGNIEACFDCRRIEGAGGEPERLLGRQELRLTR